MIPLGCEGGPVIKPCPSPRKVTVSVIGEPDTERALCWRHALPYQRVLASRPGTVRMLVRKEGD